ncbi:hypothetical protein MHYP_G00113720 [Metynnis hypsauchen]
MKGPLALLHLSEPIGPLQQRMERDLRLYRTDQRAAQRVGDLKGKKRKRTFTAPHFPLLSITCSTPFGKGHVSINILLLSARAAFGGFVWSLLLDTDG